MHSHRWERQSRSKFTSHYAWGTNIVCECKMDVKSTWIPTWHQMNHVNGHLDCFQKLPFGDRPNTRLDDHGTPNAHNRWYILIYHVWRPAWIEIHWNNIWLEAQSQMTSHYTWGSVTTLQDFGGELGRPFGHLLLGSHKATVTALGSCVKWSFECILESADTYSTGSSIQSRVEL